MYKQCGTFRRRSWNNQRRIKRQGDTTYHWRIDCEAKRVFPVTFTCQKNSKDIYICFIHNIRMVCFLQSCVDTISAHIYIYKYIYIYSVHIYIYAQKISNFETCYDLQLPGRVLVDTGPIKPETFPGFENMKDGRMDSPLENMVDNIMKWGDFMLVGG